MNNGKDGSSFPPYNNNNNNNNSNGNFNSNLTYPFQMPFFPQPSYLPQGMQNFEDIVDNFNANDAQLMQNNQFGYNMRGGESNMNQQFSSPSQPSTINGRQDAPSQSTSQVPDPPVRAAELRKKLMAMRKNSETPPNNSSSPNLPKTTKQSEALRTHGPSEYTTHAQPGDTDLDNLLSEARSVADSTARDSPVKVKNEKGSMENIRQTSQTPTKNPGAPTTNGLRAILSEKSTPDMNKSSRRTSERSVRETSEMSDGEIVDEPKPRRPLPPTGPKESELSVVKRKLAEDQAARERRDDLPTKQPDKNDHTNTLHRSPSMTSSRPAVTRYRDEGNEEPRANSKRLYQEGGIFERQPRVEEKRYERREDPVANSRDVANNAIRARNEKSKSPPQVPLLEQVLAENEELRMWLDMTGYHDAAHRETKLKKYREWVAICQRSREIQAEIGGFFQAPGETVARVSGVGGTMLPPPTPTKVNHEKPDALEDRGTNMRRSENTNATSATQNLGKRAHDDNDELGKESSEKYARIDSEGQRAKIKTEGSREYHRSETPRRSYGESESTTRYKRDEDSRRRTASPRPTHLDRRDSGGREYVDRGRGRSFNQQDHDMSGLRAYESRPRNMSRDPAVKIDNDDWKSRRLNEGLEPDRSDYNGGKGYRGKNWDPHYHENRGRGSSVNGRGRGRGMMDMSSSDVAPPPRTYGNGSAMKPRGYKEVWDRGGNGG